MASIWIKPLRFGLSATKLNYSHWRVCHSVAGWFPVVMRGETTLQWVRGIFEGEK